MARNVSLHVILMYRENQNIELSLPYFFTIMLIENIVTIFKKKLYIHIYF